MPLGTLSALASPSTATSSNTRTRAAAAAAAAATAAAAAAAAAAAVCTRSGGLSVIGAVRCAARRSVCGTAVCQLRPALRGGTHSRGCRWCAASGRAPAAAQRGWTRRLRSRHAWTSMDDRCAAEPRRAPSPPPPPTHTTHTHSHPPAHTHTHADGPMHAAGHAWAHSSSPHLGCQVRPLG
jgi:hypothetical protein